MDRKALTVLLLSEQRDWSDPDPTVATCPACGRRIGGRHGVANPPHEWLLKRNSGLPDHVIFVPINTVILCDRCHRIDGQTKEMTRKIYKFKTSRGCDVRAWLDELSRLKLLNYTVGLPELE